MRCEPFRGGHPAAVPFIFWVMAVLGWTIMVAQSLLAAPLWAASHAVPEGDGFAGRYALQGWQLMLNVITRPILLTLGLLISMFVMHAIVYFALKGYAVFNASVVSLTATIAITGIIVTNVIMTAIVIVLAHKSHELIYDLADDIMKWIGFGVTPLGSVRAEGDVKQIAKGGMEATGRMADAALSRVGGAGEAKGDNPGRGDKPTGGNKPGGGNRITGDANPAGGNPTPGRAGRAE